MKKYSLIMFFLIALLIFSSCESTPTSYDTETTAPLTETVAETEPPETEPIYDFTTDPSLYEEALGDEAVIENKKSSPFSLEGTLRTSTGTALNIIVQWSAVRNEGEDFATLKLDLAIEHKEINANYFSGIMSVNGKTFHFMSPFYQYNSSTLTREWLCPAEVRIPLKAGESKFVDVSVSWNFIGTVEGRSYNGLSLKGKIPIGEKYASIKSKVNYDVKNILQLPELPEGCEVTSLAIILNHLGFDVAHTYLADNYLEQGEVGKTDFREKNIGNPRVEGKSWGCYAPVIVKTANKYLYDMESYYRAYDYTGYDISELYYQISMGHPAIVWVTMDFEEPYLKKPWTFEERTLWWKYPLHCVVLSGYDFEKGTVTLTDPLQDEPVTVDMETFELRYKQMESQAVVIKMSKPIN